MFARNYFTDIAALDSYTLY